MDFAIKEVYLDFAKLKTAAYGLFSKGSQLLSISSNNALLEFLLEVRHVHLKGHFSHCFTSIPPENIRQPLLWFSDVFRECRSGTLVENGLINKNIFKKY